MTLQTAWDTYASLRERSKPYQAELRHTKALVEHLMSRNLMNVTAGDLSKALSGCAVSTRDARIRRLRSVWTLAVRKGCATVNVADQLDILGNRLYIAPRQTRKDHFRTIVNRCSSGPSVSESPGGRERTYFFIGGMRRNLLSVLGL